MRLIDADGVDAITEFEVIRRNADGTAITSKSRRSAGGGYAFAASMYGSVPGN